VVIGAADAIGLLVALHDGSCTMARRTQDVR